MSTRIKVEIADDMLERIERRARANPGGDCVVMSVAAMLLVDAHRDAARYRAQLKEWRDRAGALMVGTHEAGEWDVRARNLIADVATDWDAIVESGEQS